VYKCPICGCEFRKLFALAIHMHRRHKPTGSYICPACGREFHSFQGLQCHVVRSIEDPEHVKYYILFATKRRAVRKLTLKEWWVKLQAEAQQKT